MKRAVEKAGNTCISRLPCFVFIEKFSSIAVGREMPMKKITLSNGKIVEVECLSCALTSGDVKPDGGTVIETAYFHAHQDVAYPIKGLIIVASKRHIKCFDELTEDEKVDYINILTKIRAAQRKVLTSFSRSLPPL